MKTTPDIDCSPVAGCPATTCSTMKIPYEYCHFFPMVEIGNEFHLLGETFIKTGETSIEGPEDSKWSFDFPSNEIRPVLSESNARAMTPAKDQANDK